MLLVCHTVTLNHISDQRVASLRRHEVVARAKLLKFNEPFYGVLASVYEIIMTSSINLESSLAGIACWGSLVDDQLSNEA